MREIYQGLVSNPNNAADNAQNMSITHTFGGTPVVTIPKDIFNISLSVDPENSGTVSGNGSFEEWTEITVIATPDPESDYSAFDGWYEGETKVSENASYTFTVEGARTLVAKFKYGNNIIPYTASEKLPDFSSSAFGDATIVSHTFENGAGKIKFDKDVEVIGDYVFAGKSTLTSIEIPDSVTSIGTGALRSCPNLTSVVIGDSVESVGYDAFIECSSIASIRVRLSNTNYDSRENCNALIETGSNTLIAGCMNTVIPNSVTSIGGSAFRGCSGLTSVTIPNSVTSIGGNAFYGCTGLTSITIPNSVTSIGEYAFDGCSGLTSVTIPNSVTSIGVDAFRDCSGLTSITIGNSVTSIGARAFYYCPGLSSVTCEATTPPTLGNNAFVSNALGRKIYVPAASVDAYKAAEGWSTYAADIEAIPQ